MAVEHAQKMFAIERRVSVDNRLHIFAPSHTQFLARLLADIYKLSVAHVALAQIDNIHKRHATGVEAEKEKVASQCLLSVFRYTIEHNGYDTGIYCTLHCARKSGVDIVKRT